MAHHTNKRIAIIPVYNEEESLPQVLSDCEQKIDIFVFINDGSVDRSREIINEWKMGRKDVYLIDSKKNRGMSWAVKEGLRFIQNRQHVLGVSQDDIIIQIDSDGQHPLDDLDLMINYMQHKGVDYLITKRILNGYPLIKIIGNRLMSVFVSMITFKAFYDIECGFRLLRMEVIPFLLDYTVGFRYSWAQEMAVICARLGFNIDNQFLIRTNHYRPRGPCVMDAVINCFFSAVVLPMNFFIKGLSHKQKPKKEMA